MAGDWIKMEKDTPEKPELLAIAARLGISQGDAFLACFKLWRWADAQTTDGCAPRVTPALLDALCGLPGFSDALREVGWLQVRDSSLVVPNFDRHMGQPAKARVLAAARMKRRRTSALSKSDAPSATKTEPEKRREENNPPLIPPSEKQPGGTAEEPAERRATPMPGQTWVSFLATEWAFFFKGTSSRERDPALVGGVMESLLGRNVPPREILARIRDPARQRTEPTWEFEKRWKSPPVPKAESAKAAAERVQRERAEEEAKYGLAKKPGGSSGVG